MCMTSKTTLHFLINPVFLCDLRISVVKNPTAYFSLLI